MVEQIELGTVSARGQICIPGKIRTEMGLAEGTKVLFVQLDDSLILKKVNTETFHEITRPLKAQAKKSRLKESEVPEILHRFRSKP